MSGVYVRVVGRVERQSGVLRDRIYKTVYRPILCARSWPGVILPLLTFSFQRFHHPRGTTCDPQLNLSLRDVVFCWLVLSSMSWTGGARTWYSRRRAHDASEDDWSDVLSDVEPDEVPVADSSRHAAEAPSRDPAAPAMHAETNDRRDVTILSKATYQAVQDIFTPNNEVKKRTGELLLKGRQQGQYNQFSGIDLDADRLEYAGHLPPSATPTDQLHFAEQRSERACQTRCGDECSGDCRVRAFVVTAGYGTEFYFGSHADIMRSVQTQGAACEGSLHMGRAQAPLNALASA